MGLMFFRSGLILVWVVLVSGACLLLSHSKDGCMSDREPHTRMPVVVPSTASSGVRQTELRRCGTS